MKKVIKICLSVAIVCFALFAVNGLTNSANAQMFSGTCGEGVNWSLDTETGVLSITGTGSMSNYSYNSSAPWYSYRSSIKSVTISDSVTSIGDHSFSYCSSLTSIDIPNSITSIGSYAFFGCTGLTNIDIPNSVTSIGRYAFNICTSLTSINIPNSVTSIGSYAFQDCTSLTSIEIPYGVTSIGNGAFQSCTGLTNINYGGAKAEWAFVNKGNGWDDNTGDYTVNYSGGNSSVASGSCGESVNWSLDTDTGVLTISGTGAMANYSSYLDIPWNPCSSSINSIIINDGVTSIGQLAFASCRSLTSVTIPNSVTSIGSSAFTSCTGLTNIDIPSSVTSIGISAFGYCSNLTSINIPDSVTSIGNWAFRDCTSLSSITVSEANEYYCSKDGVLYNKNLTEIVCHPAGKSNPSYSVLEGVTSIGASAFSGCTGLTSIDIPNSVTSIGSGAFGYCSNLTSISVPTSVTSIGSIAFEYCTGLTSINIPNSVTSIGSYAFSGCTSLTTINYAGTKAGWALVNKDYGWDNNTGNYTVKYSGSDDPNITGTCGANVNWSLNADTGVLTVSGTGTMDNYNDAWGSFRSSIKSVIIEDGVTSIRSSAFSGCTGLTSINIPNSVTSIGHLAFANCLSLTSINIPDSVTSIGINAFQYCTSLSSIAVSEDNQYYCSEDGVLYNKDLTEIVCHPAGKSNTSYSIPDSVTSIGFLAFYGCTSLTSINIPNSVTSIGINAFQYCTSLSSINIPDGVTSIGNGAFDGCTSLSSITVSEDNEYYCSKNGVLYNKSLTELVCHPAGKSNTSYSIPDSVTSIGSSAFYGCRGLTSIDIPNSVTSIGDFAFQNCTSLTSINIPNSVTSIGRYAFNICTSLTTINYAGTNADWALVNKGVGWDDNTGNYTVKYLGGDSTVASGTCGENADWSVDTGTGVLTVSGTGAMDDYSSPQVSPISLMALDIESVEASSNPGIAPWYDYRNYIKSVKIEDGITSIGSFAFYDCPNLVSVEIPSSVGLIGESAFLNCESLEEIKYDGTQEEWNAIEKGTDSNSVLDDFINFIKTVLGDLTGDSTVTVDDALYILWHTYMPNKYPLSQACDYNKDGSVTVDDALYILWHTFMPNKYPLQ